MPARRNGRRREHAMARSMSSASILRALKPALQLEVRWRMLAAREHAAAEVLAPLADLHDRGTRRRDRAYDAWRRAGRSEAVSRIALEPS
jgi:hypothetical protein